MHPQVSRRIVGGPVSMVGKFVSNYPEQEHSILVTIPAAGCLVPVSLLLLLQIKSVSAGERSYEGKVSGARCCASQSGY